MSQPDPEMCGCHIPARPVDAHDLSTAEQIRAEFNNLAAIVPMDAEAARSQLTTDEYVRAQQAAADREPNEYLR